jgi:hypothetical protein
MRTPRTNQFLATLVLLSSACAGAEMNRSSSAGDDVGNDDSGDADSADDAPATTSPGTSGGAEETTTDDPTAGVDGGSTESDPTDPTDSESAGTSGDPATDPSATDSSATDSSATDPSTDSSTTDPSATDSDTQGAEFVDLSGYTVVQTASAREFVIPDNTIVAVGTVIVIGRNASPGTFQDFWDQNWGDEVVYFEGLDVFPTINGDETYSLLDPGQVVVDGPTPPLELSTVLARTDASLDGSDEAAWVLGVSPNDDSNPGVASATGGTVGVPYISEYADPTGPGNFDFEFVEIHVPG